MRVDWLGIVEAAYELHLDEGAWLRAVTSQVRSAVPASQGVAAWTFRGGDAAAREELVAHGLTEAHLEALTSLARQLQDADPLPGGVSAGLRSVTRGLPGAELPPAWEALEALGVRDVVFAIEADEAGAGVGLVWCRGRRARVSSVVRRRWARVLQQLVRARGVRALAARTPGGVPEPGMRARVPTPHFLTTLALPAHDPNDPKQAKARASGARGASEREARRLSAAAAMVATPPGSAASHEATTRAWRALFDGAWHVVDRFDAAGRRYYVARASDADEPGSISLEPIDAEILQRRAGGISLKVIAADLGLSVSAVSRRIERAMQALGLRSPFELAALLAAAPRS